MLSFTKEKTHPEFMATQRTKEIGVRKVLGANSLQIARLLVWQFSKPVMRSVSHGEIRFWHSATSKRELCK